MTGSGTLSPAQRLYLDAVRASAAMMVLFGHASHFFLADSFLAKGWVQGLGVYLFFLISGFLISYSVIQKLGDGRYGFLAYFIDRFCRIFSAFLPALVFVVLIDALIVNSPIYPWRRDYNLLTWVGNLFMLQDFPVFQIARRLGVPDNHWFVSSFGSARPFWTISIEWWIYMLFGGIVLVWMRRGRLSRLGFLALGFAAIEPAYHFIGGFDHCLTILWIVGMGASLLVFRLPTLHQRWPDLDAARVRRIGLLVAGGGFIAMAGRLFSNHFETGELQFALFMAALLFGLLFALGSVADRVPAPAARCVQFIAGYSYSLYLTHHTLLQFLAIEMPGREDSPALFWGSILLSNLLATVFWLLFERHYRRIAKALKQRLARPVRTLDPASRGVPAR